MEVHEVDAIEQARLLRQGQVSAVELTTHHLERIDRLEVRLHAFITITPDRALDDAARIDRDRASGRALPPLAGVPTAIKDLTETAGVRTTRGSTLWRDHVPDVDAPLARRVRAAGLVSLGKTSTPELGLTSCTDNDLVGHARTPWDTDRTAGGSTGGGAAAVAAGLVAFAPGSDGAGSLRIPASCCGIVGFKPSRGVVDRGTPAGPSDLVTDGPLGRSVRDVATLLDVLADRGPDDRFVDALDRDPPRLRVARWHRPHQRGATASTESVEAWQQVSGLLADLGHAVEDVPTPFPADLDDHHATTWAAAVASELAGDDPRLRPMTRFWLDVGRQVTADQLAASCRAVAAAVRAATVRLDAFDVWLTPTLALPPPPVGWFDAEPREALRREVRFTPYAAVHNAAGRPSISLPLHWSEATADRRPLPIGVMLAGRTGADAMLLRLAAQIERARPWSDRRPPVA